MPARKPPSIVLTIASPLSVRSTLKCMDGNDYDYPGDPDIAGDETGYAADWEFRARFPTEPHATGAKVGPHPTRKAA